MKTFALYLIMMIIYTFIFILIEAAGVSGYPHGRFCHS